MATLARPAPAKINLTLRVLGTRPDGFHELESLVALVDLADSLAVTQHEDGCYSLACDDPTLPCDGSNLVLQAARVLNRSAGGNRGAEFTLQKRIPAGAGLGGGSSDAAAALALLNDLWGVRYPPERLADLGALVGSDVPLFFAGPLCVLRGRGERVEPLPERLNAWVVLVLPALQCSTPAVYAAYDRGLAGRESPASGPRAAAGSATPPRAELPAVRGALHDPAALMPLLFNDLELAALEVCPPLRELQARAMRLAGGPVRVTGSGSALYRLFGEEAAARAFAQRVAQECGVRTEAARALS